MHTEPWELFKEVKQMFPEYFEKKKVLEAGSLDVNGSIRGFFTDCWYTGVDVGPGKGVDLVSPIHEVVTPNEFDVVCSTEMLEHDKYWQQSLKQMYDNLKPGGLFIFSCAGPTRQEHGTTRTSPKDSPFTTDYYRNISIEDFESILPLGELFSKGHITYKRGKADLLMWGIKK